MHVTFKEILKDTFDYDGTELSFVCQATAFVNKVRSHNHEPEFKKYIIGLKDRVYGRASRGTRAFGYSRTDYPDGGTGLTPKEEEYGHLVEMLKLREKGKTLIFIKKYLEDNGIHTVTGKTTWQIGTISSICKRHGINLDCRTHEKTKNNLRVLL